MLKIDAIGRATTLSNPYTDDNEFIKIKLFGTSQEVNALCGNPLDINRSTERVFIEVGTEVLVVSDEMDNFYVVASVGHGGTKKRSFETEHFEVKVADKFSVTNGSGNTSNELIAVLSELITTIIGVKTDVIGGSSKGKHPLDATSLTALGDVKTKLDTFK